MTVLFAKSRERTRFLRFLVVGTIGAVVDFGIANLLIRVFGAPYVLSGAISFICAIFSNFHMESTLDLSGFPFQANHQAVISICNCQCNWPGDKNTNIKIFRTINHKIIPIPAGEVSFPSSRCFGTKCYISNCSNYRFVLEFFC